MLRLALVLCCLLLSCSLRPVAPSGGVGGQPAGAGGSLSAGGSRCSAKLTERGAPREAVRSRAAKVVNGKPSTTDRWPVVSVQSESGWSFCAGTFYRAHWIITAAHCGVQPGERVVAGRTRLSSSAGTVAEVAAVLTHELYRSAETGDDIALLRLASDLPYPATELVPDGWEGPGELLSIVGWGLTSEGGQPSDVLLEAQVPILSAAACAVYPVTPSMLCAGYDAGGTDTCNGDSGGGAFVLVRGAPALAAITSWGRGCARPGWPGVYTAVGRFITWIRACTEET